MVECTGLGGRGARLGFRERKVERTGLLSRVGAREDCVRVGLNSRVLGLEYLGRGTLIAVSERGLLESKLAIPERVLKGLGGCGVCKFASTSESTTDPSVRVVRLGKAFRDRIGPEGMGCRPGGGLGRGIDVGKRRYRARLYICVVNMICINFRSTCTDATAFRAILVL